jgi:hypothetical protein
MVFTLQVTFTAPKKFRNPGMSGAPSPRPEQDDPAKPVEISPSDLDIVQPIASALANHLDEEIEGGILSSDADDATPKPETPPYANDPSDVSGVAPSAAKDVTENQADIAASDDFYAGEANGSETATQPPQQNPLTETTDKVAIDLPKSTAPDPASIVNAEPIENEDQEATPEKPIVSAQTEPIENQPPDESTAVDQSVPPPLDEAIEKPLPDALLPAESGSTEKTLPTDLQDQSPGMEEIIVSKTVRPDDEPPLNPLSISEPTSETPAPYQGLSLEGTIVSVPEGEPPPNPLSVSEGNAEPERAVVASEAIEPPMVETLVTAEVEIPPTEPIARSVSPRAPSPAPELSFCAMASISQRSARPATSVAAFRRMVLGVDGPPRAAAPPKKKPAESPYDSDQARKIAEELVRGKSPKILTASGIADVIHALTDIQVQAMEDGNYTQVDQIRVIVSNLRTGYRNKDRADFHDSRLSLLNGKLSEAQGKLAELQKLSFWFSNSQMEE